MVGQLLTTWTIRLALVCYVAYLGWPVCGSRWRQAARAVWTLGCILFVVHVACAFHFYHHWSHWAAWQKTAARTEELLGVAVGDGLYFSYLFLVLWVADVFWVWRTPAVAEPPDEGSPPAAATLRASGMPAARIRSETPRWRFWVHIFLAFIAVNGAIVFEDGPTRWAGLAAALALCCLAFRAAWLTSEDTIGSGSAL